MARRLRIARHGRKAYIRSVYSLPSLATLGNAICGFGAMYTAALDPNSADHWAQILYGHRFITAAYLIFLAMAFDAIDGRLARFTRHTTDFGGQLDSLSDVISFGCAPAFVTLQLLHASVVLPDFVGRLLWAVGALYMSCAAIRLARFNVSNVHGEQHHFSFLGLPSPGAGALIAGFILVQQDLSFRASPWQSVGMAMVWALPILLIGAGLLMVSHVRYPHLVNRYVRGRQSITLLFVLLVCVLAFVVSHRFVLGLASFGFVLWGPYHTLRHQHRKRRGLPVKEPG